MFAIVVKYIARCERGPASANTPLTADAQTGRLWPSNGRLPARIRRDGRLRRQASAGLKHGEAQAAMV